MTILFAGGEDINLILTGVFGTNIGVTASSSTRRTAWSRCTIWINNASGAVPPTNYLQPAAQFTATTDLWFHWWRWTNSTLQTANNVLFGAASADGVWRFLMRTVATGPTLKFSKRNAAGTITDLGSTISAGLVANEPQQMDLHINYATGGSATLYVNKVQVGTYSGDVTTDGATSLATFLLGATRTSTGSDSQFSEMIVSTTDTRYLNLLTLVPNGAGNTEVWTGAYTDVDEVTINDADMISSGTADELAEFTVSGSLPSGIYSFPAVAQSARVRQGSGPPNFQFVTRVGGTDYPTGTISPGASFENKSEVLNQSPATAAAWTQSEVFTGFNLGLKSKA